MRYNLNYEPMKLQIKNWTWNINNHKYIIISRVNQNSIGENYIK